MFVARAIGIASDILRRQGICRHSPDFVYARFSCKPWMKAPGVRRVMLCREPEVALGTTVGNRFRISCFTLLRVHAMLKFSFTPKRA